MSIRFVNWLSRFNAAILLSTKIFLDATSFSSRIFALDLNSPLHARMKLCHKLEALMLEVFVRLFTLQGRKYHRLIISNK